MKRILQLTSLLAALAWCSPAHALPALVGSATAGSSGSTPLAVTYSPTAGNIILIWVGASATNNTFTFTDNASGGSSTYTVDFTKACVSGFNSCSVAYVCSVKAGVTSFSIARSAGTVTDFTAIVAEFSGLDTTSCRDQEDSTGLSGTSTTASSNAITTTVANEVVVGLFDEATSGVTFSTNGSYTLVKTSAHDGGGASGMTYRIVSSTAAYTPAATLSTSHVWSGYAISFKSSAGGGGRQVGAFLVGP